MIDAIAQWSVLILGPLAIWMVASKGKWMRWGYIVGMVSQPFWFVTLITNEQWPILGAATIYTISWARGINNHWKRK